MVLPNTKKEGAGLAKVVAPCIANSAHEPAVLADDGRAAAREAEIGQKIEIEIAFRSRLVRSLDKAGFAVKEDSTMTGERARVSLREKYADESNRSSILWAFFFVYSKDETAPFCLSVWFTSGAPLPSTFKWRALDLDGMSVAGPSRRKTWNGAICIEATPPLCYHLSLVDARLRFRALPPPVMRATLLDGRLAEELASKVAAAFARIRALLADRDSRLSPPAPEDIERLVVSKTKTDAYFLTRLQD